MRPSSLRRPRGQGGSDRLRRLTSIQPGIMEVVNETPTSGTTRCARSPRPRAAGKALVRAFELRERFFHFEFFRTRDGSLMALEVNARPPAA